MNNKFQTKKDSFGKIIIFGPAFIMTGLLIIVLTGIVNLPIEPILVGAIMFWLFLIILWKFTYYELKNGKLIARMGYFKYRKINLADIIGYEKNQNGVWIYGLSKDILTIKVKNGQHLNISPLDPDNFISELEKYKKHHITQKLPLG